MEYYIVVIDFNIEENSLICCGFIKVFFEFLIYAVIYYYKFEIMGIIYIYNY